MTTLKQISDSQASPEVVVNQNFETVSAAGIFGKRHDATSGLTWGYYGGRYNGSTLDDGTVTLADDDDNYVVVRRSDGVVSVATTTTNWDNADDYARLYQVTAAAGAVTAVVDARLDTGGLLLGVPPSSGAAPTQCIAIACSDEATDLTTGTAKVTFRMPYAFTLAAVRASVTTAPTGAVLTVDINASGSSILSTALTIDAGEKTSATAATPAVISDVDLADDEEVTIDIDQVGSTAAGAGLKVYLIGTAA